MGTAKAQTKKALFAFLTLLLFRTILVHSQACTPQTDSLNKLNQLQTQIAQYRPPTAPACLSDMTGISNELNAITSFSVSIYGTNNPSAPTTSSYCSDLPSMSTELTSCTKSVTDFVNSFNSLFTTVNKTVDALSCDLCCAQTHGTCVSSCPAGAINAGCVSGCDATQTSCHATQTQCEQTKATLKTSITTAFNQWNSAIAKIQAPITSANKQLPLAMEKCPSPSSIGEQPNGMQQTPGVVDVLSLRQNTKDISDAEQKCLSDWMGGKATQDEVNSGCINDAISKFEKNVLANNICTQYCSAAECSAGTCSAYYNALLSATSSSDPSVRFAAITVLSKIGSMADTNTQNKISYTLMQMVTGKDPANQFLVPYANKAFIDMAQGSSTTSSKSYAPYVASVLPIVPVVPIATGITQEVQTISNIPWVKTIYTDATIFKGQPVLPTATTEEVVSTSTGASGLIGGVLMGSTALVSLLFVQYSFDMVDGNAYSIWNPGGIFSQNYNSALTPNLKNCLMCYHFPPKPKGSNT